MKIAINDSDYSALMQLIRKKLKSSGNNSAAIDSFRLEENEGKLSIFIVFNTICEISKKAQKNLLKEVSDFLSSSKITSKEYTYNDVEIVITKKGFSVSQMLYLALRDLKPNLSTSQQTINFTKILSQNSELPLSGLITIIAGHIWPELSGAKIDTIYSNKLHDLQPLSSVERNACCEARFLFDRYKELLIKLSDFFAQDIQAYAEFNKNLSTDERTSIQTIKVNLIKLNAIEFKYAQLWNKHEYYFSRFKILNRICGQIEKFYIGLTENDVGTPLWQDYLDYKKELPEALNRIKNFIKPFYETNQSIENTIETFFMDYNYRRLLGEEKKSIANQIQTPNTISLTQSPIKQLSSESTSSIQKNTFLTSSGANQPSPEKKEALELAKLHTEREERKSHSKDEKKLSSPSKFFSSGEEANEVTTYILYKNGTELKDFSLEENTIQIIKSELNFYYLPYGLIELTGDFQKILENKEDRRFLAFDHTGKSGLKLLSENIIAIKSKLTSDRVLLVCISHNNISFFLPAIQIIHAQWKCYASGQDKEELDTLCQKINSIFMIQSSKKPIKVISPEKISNDIVNDKVLNNPRAKRGNMFG